MNRLDRNLKDIRPKDLFFVILYGGVISILLGYVVGFVDYYISSTIKFSLMILLFFVSSQMVGNVIRKQYDRPHLVYSLLTGLFLLLQAAIVLTVDFGLQNIGQVSYLLDIRSYLYYVYGFFYVLFRTFNINFIMILISFIVGIYVGISRTY